MKGACNQRVIGLFPRIGLGSSVYIYIYIYTHTYIYAYAYIYIYISHKIHVAQSRYCS